MSGRAGNEHLCQRRRLDDRPPEPGRCCPGWGRSRLLGWPTPDRVTERRLPTVAGTSVLGPVARTAMWLINGRETGDVPRTVARGGTATVTAKAMAIANEAWAWRHAFSAAARILTVGSRQVAKLRALSAACIPVSPDEFPSSEQSPPRQLRGDCTPPSGGCQRSDL